MSKRIISLILSACLVWSCACTAPLEDLSCHYSITAAAETEGNLEYSINDDGTVKITAYTGTQTTVEIPVRLAGRKVKSIAPRTVGYTASGTKIENFIIKCVKGSAGESYAKLNGFEYIYLPKEHTHTFTTKTIKATCTQGGGVVHICTGCNYSYTTEQTQPLGHKLGKWELFQAPSCTADGFECRYCERCEYYEKRVLKAKGHSWGEPVWTWNGTSSASAEFVCENDKNHIRTAKAQITSVIEKAECTKQGRTTYTASVSFEGKTYTDTKTVTIDALSHKWGDKPLWTWNGTTYAAAKFVCVNDNKHTTILPAEITSVTSEATCTTDGTQTFTAKVKLNGKDYTDTKTIVVNNAKGHSFSEWKTTGTDYRNAVHIQTRSCSVCGETQTRKAAIELQRFAGSDRFDTATKISCESGLFEKADTVVLANGLNFADALAGVPLAVSYDAPILLTHVNRLPDTALAEIKRLGAKKIIILGGDKAVGTEVVKTLKANGYNDNMIKRIAGETRFGTAVKVADELMSRSGKAPSEVYFVVYNNFADALSAGTATAVSGSPILYVTKDGQPDKETSDYIQKIKSNLKKSYVIGGTAVISDSKAEIIKQLSTKPVERIWGKNRYETCIAFNSRFSDILSGNFVCAAKGLDFPDALAGGVLAAMRKAPLLLADNSLSESQKDYLKKKNAATAYIFGGTAAVSDALANEIVSCSK